MPIGGKYNRAQAYWGDGAKILNYMPVDEGSGTSVSVQRFDGATISDASLEWITEGAMTGARFKTNVGVYTAIASGSWQLPAPGSDLLVLIMQRHVDVGGPNTSNWAFGSDGLNPGCNIHMGGGSNIGPFGLETNAGEPFLPSVTQSGDVVFRAGLALENGVKWMGDNQLKGTALSFADQIPGDVGEFDSTFGDEYLMVLVNRYWDLFQMVWIEFPSGLPSDYEAKANQLFDAWEAGTKDYIA